MDVAEFRSAYLAEVDDHLEAAGASLLALERAAAEGQDEPRAAREVFRALHTIKGLSAMMGVEPIVTLAHHTEGALRGIEGKPPAPAAVDLLFQGIRAIEQRVRALSAGAPVPEPPQALLEALDAVVGAMDEEPEQASGPAELALPADIEARLGDGEREQLAAGVRAGRRALRVDFSPSPGSAEQGLTITSVRERLGAVAEIVKVIPMARAPSDEAPAGLTFAVLLLASTNEGVIADAAGLPAGAVTSLIAEPAAPRASAAPARRELPSDRPPEPDEVPRRGVIRVEVERVDEAMDRLSALVVTRYRLERCAADMAAASAQAGGFGGAAGRAPAEPPSFMRELVRLLGEQARELRNLRAALLRVRMVPMSEILERLPLILRGLRRSTGKQVRLEIEGGGAELDKAVAERIFPAIIHLVRNAVDHGIEAPDDRERAGKPREGLIRIRCAAVSNAALDVSIQDDGRGVDRSAVARRAPGEGAAAEPGEEALLARLCAPGFSTRDEATTTSGRGMGLHIVRRVVEAELGGDLSLRSEPGAGTTFTLRVPLTVAILDAFAFQCAEQRFVVPIAMVDEIVEIEPASVRVGPGGMPLFERRGAAVAVVPLRAALFGEDRGADGGGAASQGKALIVRRGADAAAFTVDRLLGQREAVIRPLTDPLVKVAGVSGATDLGDGRPTLVLDLVALLGAVSGRRHFARAEGA